MESKTLDNFLINKILLLPEIFDFYVKTKNNSKFKPISFLKYCYNFHSLLYCFFLFSIYKSIANYESYFGNHISHGSEASLIEFHTKLSINPNTPQKIDFFHFLLEFINLKTRLNLKVMYLIFLPNLQV